MNQPPCHLTAAVTVLAATLTVVHLSAPACRAETVTISGSSAEIDSIGTDIVVEKKGQLLAHTGTSLQKLTVSEESFAAVQTGAVADEAMVETNSSLHVCGGRVSSLKAGDGGTVRLTGGSVDVLQLAPRADIHVYGGQLAFSSGRVTGIWPDGSAINVRLEQEVAGAGWAPVATLPANVILHDTATEPLPGTEPWVHIRLDESRGALAHDSTSFLHHGVTGNLVALQPMGLNDPNLFRLPPSYTLSQAAIASGTSMAIQGGGGVRISGSRLPLLHEGSTISYWYLPGDYSAPILSLLTKAVPEGHPRSIALCGGSEFGGIIPITLFVGEGGLALGHQLTQNTPSHIAITLTPDSLPLWPGDIATVKAEFWINGSLVGSASGAVTADRPDMDLTVGGVAPMEEGVLGRIDDVQVYNRPVTPAEVSFLHTHPGMELTDADADTIPDDLERHRFGTMRETPQSDYDGDGFSNAAETEITGTDPVSAASALTVSSVRINANSTSVTWRSVPGRKYTLESASRPDAASWTTVASLTATGTESSATHLAAPGRAFYRIRASAR
jgi:Concanavalin A-like lectin/glucanases superfamily